MTEELIIACSESMVTESTSELTPRFPNPVERVESLLRARATRSALGC